MEQKLEFGDCYYQSSFFNMKIDVPIDLTNLSIIPEGTLGLYFHEYIHYLQDISTIYGLMNISTVNFYIQSCASFIAKKNKGKQFDVPILLDKIIDNYTSNVGVMNLDLKPIYLGSKINRKFKKIQDFHFEIINYNYRESNYIEKVIINFKDCYGTSHFFEFGGNILTEGMAYLCEQQIFFGILPIAEDYPYLIVDMIVEISNPEILDNKILIIALCDLSLMTYHPGHSFIRLLNFVKNEEIIRISNDITELYKRCAIFLKGSHPELSTLIDIVKNDIKLYFNSSHFDDIIDWIEKLFENVKYLRTESPSFIIDLVTNGSPIKNQYFIKVFSVLGSPMTLDGDGNGTISLPYNCKKKSKYFNPALFMGINQILRTFYMEKPSSCKLIKYCSANINTNPVNINKNCQESQWEKIKEKTPCPYSQMWHHWALKDFSPKYELH